MTPVCTATASSPHALGGLWTSTRAQIVLAACACGGATAFLAAVDPNRHAIYPQCLLYNLTGIYCAGCGATRALYALLHGRMLDALHDNALFIAVLPLVLYVIGSYTARAWIARAWPAIPLNGRALGWRGIGFTVVMIAFMILRNLPGWPFDWLKPLPPGG